jgi:hypothetical protein
MKTTTMKIGLFGLPALAEAASGGSLDDDGDNDGRCGSPRPTLDADDSASHRNDARQGITDESPLSLDLSDTGFEP